MHTRDGVNQAFFTPTHPTRCWDIQLHEQMVLNRVSALDFTPNFTRVG